MRQFPAVNSQYGAPLGRHCFGNDCEPGTLRLFKVRLDSGGYDDGGAYWGHGPGFLWCATDGEGYRQFTRANSRIGAILKLEIFAEWLIVKPTRELQELRRIDASALGNDSTRQKIEDLRFLGFGC